MVKVDHVTLNNKPCINFIQYLVMFINHSLLKIGLKKHRGHIKEHQNYDAR